MASALVAALFALQMAQVLQGYDGLIGEESLFLDHERNGHSKRNGLFKESTNFNKACPPGFVHDNALQNCKCAWNSGPEDKYAGIKYCNMSLMRACREETYWIGYMINKTESEDTLISGYCPKGFCSPSHKLLPNTADRVALNNLICSDNQTGMLCGHCEKNCSVYFHSLDLKCRPNDVTVTCEWGPVFYLLSEIIPVTVIFLVILFFNIPFTSGLVNGFIFYCQVIESIRFQALDLTSPTKETGIAQEINSLLYLSFSLELFVHNDLSFCLWRTANAMDILAFKYATLAYALALIFLVTFVMPYCARFRRLQRVGLLRKHFKFKRGIIHGLSAFLVLCYAQCARCSFMILTSIEICSKGSVNCTLVTYFGGVEWMSGGSDGHLLHAMFAIISTVLILILPPALLLIYPLHNRVLSCLKIGEKRCVRIVFSPLDKIKPFFDSFQSCFKDEFRFFSGLYFVYRCSILLSCLMLPNSQESFFILEIQLVGILILHALCQPYKKRLHNVIDALLFGNLAVINTILYYDFNLFLSISNASGPMESNHNSADHSQEKLLKSFACALTILPIPLMAACILAHTSCVRKCWNKICAKLGRNASTIEDSTLLLSAVRNRHSYGTLRF